MSMASAGKTWRLRWLNIYSFIHLLFLAVLGPFCCAWASSSCIEWGPLSSCGEGASHCGGFSSSRAQTLGHMCFSSYCYQGVWDPTSQTRPQTCVPHVGKQMPNPWTTREVPGHGDLMTGSGIIWRLLNSHLASGHGWLELWTQLIISTEEPTHGPSLWLRLLHNLGDPRIVKLLTW